jgi:two-component system, OmpR family, sensor histidine kinase QseC
VRRPTLTRHLLAWTLGTLLVLGICFIAFAYKTGQHEADELTDGHLASTTALLLTWSHGELTTGPKTPPPAAMAPLKGHDYQQSLSVVMWNTAGRVIAHSGDAPVPDFNTVADGFSTLALGEPPTRWRAYASWNADRSRKAMMMLSLDERDALAQDIAEQSIEPGLWLLPVLALALGLAVRRGLQPLYEMSREVHALDIHQSAPLKAPRHAELAEVIEAVNVLVERYHAALNRERDLASEFAHELRTPLAALALQARGLRDIQGEAERFASIVRVEQQALHAGEVLTQLLALARTRRADLEETAAPVNMTELARHVVGQLAPHAHAGGRELSLEEEGSGEGSGENAAPLLVTGHATLLEVALRNLVENSLSHTPPGTLTEVRVDSQRRSIAVADHWPRDRSTDWQLKPSRALGLGLGHRVVGKIAEIHGAHFQPWEGAADEARSYRIAFPDVR